LGSAPGFEGRMIGDIWRWTRLELEGSPSAFNWMFPMPDNDVVGGGLPLYPEDVIHFKSHAILQANARKSLAWFAGIIGLSMDGVGGIAKGPSFTENFDPQNPMTIRRIRRVLRFLKMIGLDDDAKHLLGWLEAEAASEHSRFPRTLVLDWRKRIEPANTADSGDAMAQAKREE